MMNRKILIVLFCFLSAQIDMMAQLPVDTGKEPYRPQVHFSPKANWINDPNGMVYYKGVYHLFFQYYPESNVWGPMHWGHAISSDMINWTEQPIALYPDSLGYIFSGSVVVDKNNTSGFGTASNPPLVAIFTHHNPKGKKANRNDFQYQSLAYSIDDGKTWTKYNGNPVLHNPGIRDFRDPKVMWYEPQKKWIMTLATADRVTFYSSPDLKNWKKESEFGAALGAHGGVWECPDLFALDHNGKQLWVLIVNLNPGGPNGGSATQYFIGNFDGKNFTTTQAKTKWLDYGPDEYAGITWSNTGNRKIFLGWMSNWQYATLVPTKNWRNAMTLPRELTIKQLNNELLIASEPVEEITSIHTKPVVVNNLQLTKHINLKEKIGQISFPCRINIIMNELKDVDMVIANNKAEELRIGYDAKTNQYFIDRTKSGKTDFFDGFAAKHVSPRFTRKKQMNLSLIIDRSSVELFADDGLTVMTEIFFPTEPFNQIHIQSADKVTIKKLEYITLKSIWK